MSILVVEAANTDLDIDDRLCRQSRDSRAANVLDIDQPRREDPHQIARGLHVLVDPRGVSFHNLERVLRHRHIVTRRAALRTPLSGSSRPHGDQQSERA